MRLKEILRKWAQSPAKEIETIRCRPRRGDLVKVPNGTALLLYPTREIENRQWFACVVTDKSVCFNIVSEASIL